MHVSLAEQGGPSEDREPEGHELAKELGDPWDFRHHLAEETRPEEESSCSRFPPSQPSPVPRELRVLCDSKVSCVGYLL